VPGDYWATVAGWQANGYVARFHDYLVDNLDCIPGVSDERQDGCKHLQLRNIARSGVPAMDGQPAKPGVTTQILIDEQLPVATALLRERNGHLNPSNDVEVVTLTVGGNDVFGPITSACLGGTPAQCGAAIQTAFAAFGVNYRTILGALRDAAGPDAPIMTMTYYNPLPFCVIGQRLGSEVAQDFGDWVLRGGTFQQMPLPVGFNGLIRQISQTYGAQVADTFGALGAGDFVGGADCLHPNASGHAKIAETFETAWEGHL